MGQASRARPVLRFGVFELDPDAGALRRAGLEVRLQPQALRVLVALLERPGEVVSRGEPRLLLWGGETFVAFDRSLNFCLSRLRGALGDDARCPRFVETVPGRGYRFIAPVASAVHPPGEAERSAARPPERPGRLASATALAAVLLLTLSLAPRRALEPHDPVARALYSRARALCGEAGFRRSVALYREAVVRDPRFAAAHAGMAESYLALGEAGALEASQAFPAARDAARRALELEERADARLVLGRVRLAYEWDWPGAERELRRALALDPASVRGFVSLARLLSSRGDHEGAIATARRAETLDPGAAEAVEELAWCYYRARRLDEAARQFRLVGEQRPEDAHHLLFALFRQAGRHQEALREADALMRRVGVTETDRVAVRRLAPAAAEAAYLRGTLAYLRRDASRNRVPPERIALLHAALGDSRSALDWLSVAVAQRSPGLITALVDPTLDALRADPDFVTLVHQVGPRSSALKES